MSGNETMPAWPERQTHTYGGKFSATHWQADAYDAAMARLRVAVEALQATKRDSQLEYDCVASYERIASEALTAIGPLPEEAP